MRGMHTASDSTWHSINITHWFRTCPNFVARLDFWAAHITLSMHRALCNQHKWNTLFMKDGYANI